MKTIVTFLFIAIAFISCDSNAPTERDMRDSVVNETSPDPSMQPANDTLNMNKSADSLTQNPR